MNALQRIKNCKIGNGTKIWDFVNLYGSEIGEECMIAAFVEIQEGVKIGNRVKIESHSFICEGVTIEDNVFVGHHVVFTNYKYPKAVNKQNQLVQRTDWKPMKTVIKKGASIGSNATILSGLTIGENATIGAGSVVTKDIPANAVAYGNPARVSSKRI